MKSLSRAIIAVLVAVVIGAGLIYWRSTHAAAVNITAEDMELLIADAPPQALAQFEDEEARKEVAKNIKELLAVSEDARAQGVANEPDVKRKLELIRASVLGASYARQQQKQAAPGAPFSIDNIASKDEVDKFVKELDDPKRKEEFDATINSLKGKGMPDPTPEELETFKQQYAQTMIAARKAEAAGLDKDRKVQLQIMLQQARVLNEAYDEKLTEKTKATDAEIDAYLKENPDLDDEGARAKAEELVKRIRGGEDFATLAGKYSSDPGSKTKGGDLDYFGRGRMVKEFEDAAFSTPPGQVSDPIKTPFGYHIIKVEDKRTKDVGGKSEDQVRARHILIGITKGQPDNPMMPKQADPRERARTAIEAEKQKKILDDILSRTRVQVADNFKVEVPPMPAMPQGFPAAPPAGAEGMNGAEGEEMQTPPPAPAMEPAAKGAKPRKP